MVLGAHASSSSSIVTSFIFPCRLSLLHPAALYPYTPACGFGCGVPRRRRRTRTIGLFSSTHRVTGEEKRFRICTNADKREYETDAQLQTDENMKKEKGQNGGGTAVSAVLPSVSPSVEKDLKKAVNKAAATFAPRASSATKNPAVPGTALYRIFEVQGYASMFLGGVLSFNLIFPSNEPDIWRLMGMWSVWMFTIPSLRARDCSNKEKEALNYLFLLIPLLNIIIPFFWKSFGVVWSADTIAFFGMYTWKLGWLRNKE